ncbi:hypothetical protein P799_24475 [Lysinibacillus sphaericus CBAM5]|uniref:Uncharacterized protein n=1 Tax=Lysinibacillus sphaericus CBAM5 TaxID=1400869 RepID=W7S1U0_LYSSH|nr:hypothetical protein P799_24475 [Lysinibacillus sphaericus CBAM5]
MSKSINKEWIPDDEFLSRIKNAIIKLKKHREIFIQTEEKSLIIRSFQKPWKHLESSNL